MKQRKRLERAHKHHPPVPQGERYGPLAGGTWVRPGRKRVRPDLDGWRLVDAVEWMADRRAFAWTANDASIIAELEVRCFMFGDLERRIVHSRPAWLEHVVAEQWRELEGPGLPRSGGFMAFVGDLVHARRSHAVGLFISQTDAAALYGISDRQFRRWIAHAEAAKLVRVVQTWAEDTASSSRHRRWGRTLYMLGSAIIERAGVGLYEGLELELPSGQPMAPAATGRARALRRERREALRARHDEVWRAATENGRERRARVARDGHSLNCLDMVSGSTRLGRETGPGPVVPGAVPHQDSSAARTSPHIEVAPEAGRASPSRGKVGPSGRNSAAVRPRSGARTRRIVAPTPCTPSRDETPPDRAPKGDGRRPDRDEGRARAAWSDYDESTVAEGLALLERLRRGGLNCLVFLALLLATGCSKGQNFERLQRVPAGGPLSSSGFFWALPTMTGDRENKRNAVLWPGAARCNVRSQCKSSSTLRYRPPSAVRCGASSSSSGGISRGHHDRFRRHHRRRRGRLPGHRSGLPEGRA